MDKCKKYWFQVENKVYEKYPAFRNKAEFQTIIKTTPTTSKEMMSQFSRLFDLATFLYTKGKEFNDDAMTQAGLEINKYSKLGYEILKNPSTRKMEYLDRDIINGSYINKYKQAHPIDEFKYRKLLDKYSTQLKAKFSILWESLSNGKITPETFADKIVPLLQMVPSTIKPEWIDNFINEYKNLKAQANFTSKASFINFNGNNRTNIQKYIDIEEDEDPNFTKQQINKKVMRDR